MTRFAVHGVSQIHTNKYSGRFYATQCEHPQNPPLPCPQRASSGIENVFGVEWRRRGDALRWTGARMTGKKARCVVCIGKHNPCAECKRKKTAAAAPPASCRQCRRSPCDCPASSLKRPRTAASESTARPRCASCGAWANSCDDCQWQPPADPLPLTFCPACTVTPCCKGGCCQFQQIRRRLRTH